jgi:hypothetical protein
MLRLEKAAMKQPPVRSLPFEKTRFIKAVKKTQPFKILVRASLNTRN